MIVKCIIIHQSVSSGENVKLSKLPSRMSFEVLKSKSVHLIIITIYWDLFLEIFLTSSFSTCFNLVRRLHEFLFSSWNKFEIGKYWFLCSSFLVQQRIFYPWNFNFICQIFQLCSYVEHCLKKMFDSINILSSSTNLLHEEDKL